MLPKQFSDYQPQSGLSQSGESFISREKLAQYGIGTYIAPEGENKLVFVPHPTFKAYWGFQGECHYSVGPEQVALLCPRAHARKLLSDEDIKQAETRGINPAYCPLCEQWKHYLNLNDRTTARPFGPRHRTIYLVFDMSSAEKMMEGPKIYDAPRGRDDGTMGIDSALRKHLSYAYHNIFAYVPPDIAKAVPELGPDQPLYNLVFNREGSGIQTGYMIMGIQPAEFKLPNEMVELASKLPAVSDLLIFHDTEYVQKKMATVPTAKPLGTSAAVYTDPGTGAPANPAPTNTLSNKLDSAIEEIEKDDVPFSDEGAK